jgi:trehalose 6-phosphate synthase
VDATSPQWILARDTAWRADRTGADGSCRGQARAPSLVCLAHRLPVHWDGNGWAPSPGGLATVLRSALEHRGGTWVGASGGSGAPLAVEGLAFRLWPVDLPATVADGGHLGFANRTLWPLLHGAIVAPVLERAWFDDYRALNTRFAAAALAAAGRAGHAEFWVHDYHLMLVPDLLRAAGAGVRCAYFLHVPFPPPSVFARLPWRGELLRGVLGADAVGFQTEEDRANFVEAAASLRHVAHDGAGLRLADGRRVRTMVAPAPVDAASLAEESLSAPVERELGLLRHRFAGRCVLLGVDRLDYTKGLPERLGALEALLERRPDLRGRLAFVQIAVPSRERVPEYRALRRRVEQIVARINERFATPGGDPPVHYVFRSVPRVRLLALYRLADLALVTPLKDGMNLVAKEFVAAQAAGRHDGALLLSEFAGAARELTDAIRCNPFDVEGLSRVIEAALDLDRLSRWRRLERMAAVIGAVDTASWAERQLAPLADPGFAPAAERTAGFSSRGLLIAS